MRTPSVDTHSEAERIMIEVIRRSPMSRRFRLVQSLTQSAFWTTLHAWQERHPEVSEQEAAVHVLSYSYGPGLAKRVQAALERREGWHLQPIDLLAVMLSIRRVLEDLCVPYYLGGSIASSLHGMQQLAQEIDLVVDLGEQTLDERYPPIPLASATEMLLFKVQRYQRDEQARTDGMQDDAAWNDILGMLEVQGPDLDLALLAAWVGKLDVRETWHRALVDAGLQEA